MAENGSPLELLLPDIHGTQDQALADLPIPAKDLPIPAKVCVATAQGTFAAKLREYVNNTSRSQDYPYFKKELVFLLWCPVFCLEPYRHLRTRSAIRAVLWGQFNAFWSALNPYGIDCDETADILSDFLKAHVFGADGKVAKTHFPAIPHNSWDGHPMLNCGCFDYSRTLINAPGSNANTKAKNGAGGENSLGVSTPPNGLEAGIESDREVTTPKKRNKRGRGRSKVPAPSLLPVPTAGGHFARATGSNKLPVGERKDLIVNKRKQISPLSGPLRELADMLEEPGPDHLPKKLRKEEQDSDHQVFINKTFGPIALPTHIQHQIFSIAQSILEKSCWAFLQAWVPKYRSDATYARAQNFELSIWLGFLNSELQNTPEDSRNIAALAGRGPMKDVLATLKKVQDIAIHRRKCSVEELKGYLALATDFTRFLKYDSGTKKARILKITAESVIDDAKYRRFVWAGYLKTLVDGVDREIKKLLGKKEDEKKKLEEAKNQLAGYKKELANLKEALAAKEAEIQMRMLKIQDDDDTDFNQKLKCLEDEKAETLKLVRTSDERYLADIDWNIPKLMAETDSDNEEYIYGFEADGDDVIETPDIIGNAVDEFFNTHLKEYMDGTWSRENNRDPATGLTIPMITIEDTTVNDAPTPDSEDTLNNGGE
ncbi:hypothetical protein TWF481_007575 [Arthrobotrys musiformis]|uniref:Uncharacterized protein n=1 Tax=Arthrobotrys musiformis TaxID=47236 RepID=A0AAV9WHM2_9PEZI